MGKYKNVQNFDAKKIAQNNSLSQRVSKYLIFN